MCSTDYVRGAVAAAQGGQILRTEGGNLFRGRDILLLPAPALENAGLLKAENKGNRKVYHANSAHPLFNDIHRLVLKHSGITQVIEEVVERVGDISKVWVRGDFAVGKDSDLIDLVIAGKNIDVDYFENLIQKAGKIVKRQICYTIILPKQEAEYFIPGENKLLVWTK